jgi:hypothetical protein
MLPMFQTIIRWNASDGPVTFTFIHQVGATNPAEIRGLRMGTAWSLGQA